jgi:hypothetical protein
VTVFSVIVFSVIVFSVAVFSVTVFSVTGGLDGAAARAETAPASPMRAHAPTGRLSRPDPLFMTPPASLVSLPLRLAVADPEI